MKMRTVIKNVKIADEVTEKTGIRPVELHTSDGNYHYMSVDHLLEMFKWWIIGEEEKYPQSDACMGRWMIFKKIEEVFNNTPKPEDLK